MMLHVQVISTLCSLIPVGTHLFNKVNGGLKIQSKVNESPFNAFNFVFLLRGGGGGGGGGMRKRKQ